MLKFYGLRIVSPDNTDFEGNYTEFKTIEKLVIKFNELNVELAFCK